MRLFSLCPRIRKNGGRVIATSAWRSQILSLGSSFREVIVDPKRKAIRIRSRWLWFFRKTESIRFSKIEAVTYGYEDQAINLSMYNAHDALDCFSVGLRLYNDREIRLFKFFGEGSFVNDSIFPDWMYWEEYAFDINGSQEAESRVFVDLLAKLINVTVVPPAR